MFFEEASCCVSQIQKKGRMHDQDLSVDAGQMAGLLKDSVGPFQCSTLYHVIAFLGGSPPA